jgi:cytidylate kinase
MLAESKIRAMVLSLPREKARHAIWKSTMLAARFAPAMTISGALPFVVTIDGPAGAGKSTAARSLAARLGYTYLDTGALYRSVALIAQRRQIAWDDALRLGELARDLEVVLTKDGEKPRVMADGCDVTDEIRKPSISEGASQVSALPEVRAGLLEIQRRVASKANVVAEGRDIGTVVFPAAAAKFFLVANAETRARRRTLELQTAGRPAIFEEVFAEMLARDARDSARTAAPLRRAEDAIEIDTSGVTPEEVVERMMSVVRARGG